MVARRGSGGAGIVYRAIDDRLGRTVAIKLLQRGLADDPIFLRRFRDEAQAAAQLNHPNIMKVFDWGSDEGEPYLVMEYLSNGSLRELHARGSSLSTSQVVQIGAATASALAYSHHRNFLHRDIKPANLLFDDGGRVRIADFGLVRALSETTVTETGGGILGTPRYMAPEQVEGKRSVPGSDVYSLGLVLYEALFGAIPFQGDTQLALAFARLRDPVVNPLPDDPVARSIVSMLARDPDSRPSAAEIEHEWNGFARDLTNPEPLFAPGAGTLASTPEVVMDDSLQWLADGSTVAVDLTDHLALARDESSTAMLADQTRENTDHTSALDISNTPRLTPVPQDMEEVGSRRPWWLLFFLLPILVAAALGGAVLYQRLRTIKVDDVANLTASSASQRLRGEGIAHIALESRYSSKVPSGRVIGSSPSGGQSIHPDSSVVLYVSKGHAPVYVASFQSAQFTTAQHALTAKGFLVRPTYEYSPDVPAGVVMSESPVNQKVPYHSVVKFIVSKGPAPRPVPNVVGVSLTTAEGDLTNQGFTYSVQKQYSNSVSNGDVISQSVSAGTVSAVGTSVTLVESLGPHYVRVPNVVGDALGTAESTLQSQGFVVGTVSAPFGGSIVQYESPGAGQTALYGASVNLLVIP
ncbi:Stk1 family PASTA domain-containing Ser/Thr kinase [Ferrimicrobium acidiphilum]|uniref:Stk1 family PASTA domain-containing Ser/Thr kinase n=1 Tax=Ferrimicrobium acidiphilum TaxID=121039 RepID=UPI0023F4757C|nr:Stk1 family PASTA domain-containing Ser/Thr kinase [Ferrimicrobium acidiphilum]